MKKLIKKIYYIGGTIFRGSIGVLHNLFDNPKLNKNLKSFIIGKTVEGREILVYKFCRDKSQLVQTEKDSSRAVTTEKLLIIAGIHGNEVGTVKLATKILNYLNLNKESLGWSEVFIIPCLNLDGYSQAKKNPDYIHRGNLGRFNSNQIDLNRNFIKQSEIEVKNLINFIQQENIKNIITLHNVESKVYIDPERKNEVENKWAEIYKKLAKFKTGSDSSDSNQKGSMGPWTRENNLNYMTVEGSTRWGSDWQRQRKAIIEILRNRYEE